MGRAYEVRKASIQKTGAARGKVYAMYAKEIYSAAKKSTDPDSNPTLKRLMEKVSSEKAIAKAEVEFAKFKKTQDKKHISDFDREVKKITKSVKKK